MSCRDGTSRSSGSSAQMTAITLASRSRSGTTSQCLSQAHGPRPFITDRYMRCPAGRRDIACSYVSRKQPSISNGGSRSGASSHIESGAFCASSSSVQPVVARVVNTPDAVSGSWIETFRNPSACRIPSQVAWRIASTAGVSASRDDTWRSSRSASRWCAAAASSWKLWSARATWSATATSTSSSSSDGRVPVIGLADRQDPQHVPVGVEHRHEQLVVGVPGVGVGARLPGGDVPLADVALPVERPVRDQVGAAALEPLVEERGPRGPVERVAEERPARVVGAVDRRHLEVVPGGPVEVDDDGVEPERRRDRIRDRLEQGRLLGPFPDEPGDLQEAAKAVDGRRVLGHGATKGSARLEPGCRAVL